MAGVSNYTENIMLDAVFGSGSPATLYFALYTTAPNFETGSGGTEVSGNNYSRLAVTNDDTNFPDSVTGRKSNGVDFTFATPSGSWGTVEAFGILDASSSGNFIAGANLITPRTISSGETVVFDAGNFVITMD